METTWETKVNKVIAKLCYASWYQANHNAQGKRYKKHRPYSIPKEAERLVEALGMPDRREAEIKAKTLMELYRQQGKEID